MSARFTLLVITRTRLARADAARGAEPVIALGTRPDETALAAQVDAAARLAGPLRGPVWILAEDLFTQSLAVSARAVADLPPAQVDKLLGFEAQTLSGIPASDAVLGWTDGGVAGSDREYRIVQMQRGERDQAEETVRRLGGKLEGIGHPSGLPGPLSAIRGSSTWRRVEIWHDGIAVVEGAGGAATRVQITHTDPNRWRQSPAEERATTEVLSAGDAVRGAVTEGVIVDLEDDAGLRAWIGKWTAALSASPVQVPVVRPEKRALAPSAAVGVAAALVLLVAALCGLHALWLSRQRTALRTDFASARAPLQALQQARSATAPLERQRVELEAEISRDVERAAVLERARRTPAEILRALAAARPGGVVLEAIDLGLERSTASGACTAPELADAYAGALEARLAASGIRVEAPLKKRAEDGRYRFEIRMAPQTGAGKENP